MVSKRTMTEVSLQGKKVLVRLDLNCPLKEGEVADDFRIIKALPTIKHILEQGGSAVLMSHLGRPKGQVKAEFSLEPVRKRLEQLLDSPVLGLDQVVGPEVKAQVEKLQPGEVILLENLRFEPGEKKDDMDFARALAELGDIYVNDAFGCSHRKHSSVSAITHLLPTYCGLLIAGELDHLTQVKNPATPLIALLGGAKVDTKLPIIRELADKADKLLLGGAMSYTFLLAQGKTVGKSLVDLDYVDECREVWQAYGHKIVLPLDHIVAREIRDGEPIWITEEIPQDKKAADIGPATVHHYSQLIWGGLSDEQPKTVVWNGPMGVVEQPAFSWATHSLILQMAGLPQGFSSIAGGGDAVAALRKFGLLDHLTFVSTGGGAFIEFICGHNLPGIECLPDK